MVVESSFLKFSLFKNFRSINYYEKIIDFTKCKGQIKEEAKKYCPTFFNAHCLNLLMPARIQRYQLQLDRPMLMTFVNSLLRNESRGKYCLIRN